MDLIAPDFFFSFFSGVAGRYQKLLSHMHIWKSSRELLLSITSLEKKG